LKILLMGNPNVGKSVIFSRLTGIEVVSANYPGTTVEYMEGRMKLGEQMATLVDAPGVYSLMLFFPGTACTPQGR
jgi:ferrous iron transport protein B